MNYDVDYFIDKFQRIPEENWWTGRLHNDEMTKFCAGGHCGVRYGGGIVPEARALILLFRRISSLVGRVNDGENDNYQQPTPKQRILAALRDIKAKQEAEKPKADIDGGKLEPKIIYRTVVIDSAVRELQETIGEN